jgi:hypothetical protein
MAYNVEKVFCHRRSPVYRHCRKQIVPAPVKLSRRVYSSFRTRRLNVGFGTRSSRAAAVKLPPSITLTKARVEIGDHGKPNWDHAGRRCDRAL